jgi:hypothetical protein
MKNIYNLIDNLEIDLIKNLDFSNLSQDFKNKTLLYAVKKYKFVSNFSKSNKVDIDRKLTTKKLYQIITILLNSKQFDINSYDEKGYTILMIASMGKKSVYNFNKYKMVKLILSQDNLDLNKKTKDGKHILELKMNSKIKKLLISNGLDLNDMILKKEFKKVNKVGPFDNIELRDKVIKELYKTKNVKRRRILDRYKLNELKIPKYATIKILNSKSFLDTDVKRVNKIIFDEQYLKMSKLELIELLNKPIHFNYNHVNKQYYKKGLLKKGIVYETFLHYLSTSKKIHLPEYQDFLNKVFSSDIDYYPNIHNYVGKTFLSTFLTNYCFGPSFHQNTFIYDYAENPVKVISEINQLNKWFSPDKLNKMLNTKNRDKRTVLKNFIDTFKKIPGFNTDLKLRNLFINILNTLKVNKTIIKQVQTLKYKKNNYTNNIEFAIETPIIPYYQRFNKKITLPKRNLKNIYKKISNEIVNKGEKIIRKKLLRDNLPTRQIDFSKSFITKPGERYQVLYNNGVIGIIDNQDGTIAKKSLDELDDINKEEIYNFLINLNEKYDTYSSQEEYLTPSKFLENIIDDKDRKKIKEISTTKKTKINKIDLSQESIFEFKKKFNKYSFFSKSFKINIDLEASRKFFFFKVLQLYLSKNPNNKNDDFVKAREIFKKYNELNLNLDYSSLFFDKIIDQNKDLYNKLINYDKKISRINNEFKYNFFDFDPIYNTEIMGFIDKLYNSIELSTMNDYNRNPKSTFINNNKEQIDDFSFIHTHTLNKNKVTNSRLEQSFDNLDWLYIYSLYILIFSPSRGKKEKIYKNFIRYILAKRNLDFIKNDLQKKYELKLKKFKDDIINYVNKLREFYVFSKEKMIDLHMKYYNNIFDYIDSEIIDLDPFINLDKYTEEEKQITNGILILGEAVNIDLTLTLQEIENNAKSKIGFLLYNFAVIFSKIKKTTFRDILPYKFRGSGRSKKQRTELDTFRENFQYIGNIKFNNNLYLKKPKNIENSIQLFQKSVLKDINNPNYNEKLFDFCNIKINKEDKNIIDYNILLDDNLNLFPEYLKIKNKYIKDNLNNPIQNLIDKTDFLNRSDLFNSELMNIQNLKNSYNSTSFYYFNNINYKLELFKKKFNKEFTIKEPPLILVIRKMINNDKYYNYLKVEKGSKKKRTYKSFKIKSYEQKEIGNSVLQVKYYLAHHQLDINITGYLGQTPLIVATFIKNINLRHEIVNLILSHPNIDINKTDHSNTTPLWYVNNINYDSKLSKILTNMGGVSKTNKI